MEFTEAGDLVELVLMERVGFGVMRRAEKAVLIEKLEEFTKTGELWLYGREEGDLLLLVAETTLVNEAPQLNPELHGDAVARFGVVNGEGVLAERLADREAQFVI